MEYDVTFEDKVIRKGRPIVLDYKRSCALLKGDSVSASISYSLKNPWFDHWSDTFNVKLLP